MEKREQIDELEILNNYPLRLLKNFFKKDLGEYLKSIDGEFNTIQKELGIYDYSTYKAFLDSKLQDFKMEADLFRAVSLTTPETFYYYPLNIDLETNIETIFECLNSDSRYTTYIDKKLFEFSQGGLLSIRRDENKLIFLFEKGIAITSVNKDKKAFYVSCTIDFDKKLLYIGYMQGRYTRLQLSDKISIRELLANIIGQIEKMPLKGIEIQKFGEQKLLQAFYKMFLEESTCAIDVIKTKADGDIDEKVNVALKELEVIETEIIREKLTALKYQDIALRTEITDFIKTGGYIFGFSLIDRRITRSRNKNHEHNPVYMSKIYWSLKDLIDDYQELSEVAFSWKFYKNDFGCRLNPDKYNESKKTELVEVEYKITNNDLEIHYYKTNGNPLLRENARNKEDKINYVLYKIEQYL
ncbi:hypothetical protein HB820_08905 [Listeria booriae]|uniref:hypothetical protein n=1 Tax=Listeria booriae TaxID=1552123 RepID=UPI00162737E1|nr:hypothetical protein [Listeria booriae]MBC1231370.1 hypothetical protein [Listeria booriae]MBC1335421.1 hypothetical protein [Listeria booriae]